MPERNTRVVILGTPKADKEFELFDAERAKAQGDVKRLLKEAEKLRADARRAASRSRRER